MDFSIFTLPNVRARKAWQKSCHRKVHYSSMKSMSVCLWFICSPIQYLWMSTFNICCLLFSVKACTRTLHANIDFWYFLSLYDVPTLFFLNFSFNSFYVILLCKWMLWNSVCASLKPWSNFTSMFALRNFKDAQKLRLDQNFILITFLTSLFIFLLQFSSFPLQEIFILLTMSKEKKKWKKKFSHFSYFFSPYSHSQLN